MGKKRILLIVFAVVVLGLLGGGGFFAYQMFLAPPPEEAVVEAPPEPRVTMGPVYALDPFLVNLADPGRPRFLKLVMQVELDAQEVQVELDTLKPKVRDSLLTLLSSKASADLVTIADKERLRNEVLHRLNAFLSAGRVVEVYFMDFVVQ
ncbi:MAG: flagellar basal body-associated FliL family protein [Deferrisomatales bacterium]|nr:flagellar basal body-associated FliL family protein [Deferrisomatales bacterium]